jgi:glycosyltransferase involved in cell wall biosynthesis
LKAPLKILIITPWYPFEGNRQFGVFVRHFAERLSEQHTVTVVALIEQTEVREETLIRTRVSPHFEEFIQLIPKATNPVFRVLKRKKAARQLMDISLPSLKSFDLIHFHVLSPLHYCFVSEAIKMKVPYVVTEHWTIYARGLFKKLNPISQLRIKKMAKRAVVVMPVSSFLQRSMEAVGVRANYVVVPNMVPEVEHGNFPKHERVTLLAVGDLVDGVKNFSGMIQTLKVLHDSGRKFYLNLIGHGPDSKSLDDLCSTLNLSAYVHFLGELPHHKVLEEMQRSHVYLMASPLETFSISTLEALKCGTPVVTTDCGGIHEYFEDLGGVIVHPFDIEKYAEAVISIIDHPEWYRAEALRAAFGPKCTPEKVIAQLNGVYAKVLDK